MARIVGAGLISALASAALGVDCAYADGPFNFSPFASPPPQSPSDSPAVAPPAANAEPPPPPPPRVRNENPRTTAAGFDPEALERGAKALREISDSPHGKKVLNFEFLLL